MKKIAEVSVCNPTHANKLRDLGLKGKTLMYWAYRTDTSVIYLKTYEEVGKLLGSAKLSYICSAFTCGELGVLLKDSEYHKYKPQIVYDYGKQMFIGKLQGKEVFTEVLEINIRARLLIELLKKKNGRKESKNKGS